MNYKKYCVIGSIFTIIFGTLLHFTYEFFGESDVVAIFSAVNESTWEHLKLLYFPVIVFAAAEYFIYGKGLENFWASKMVSLISGMFFIVAAFYTYTGIIGKNFAVIDISLFVIGVIITYYLNCKFIERQLFGDTFLNKLALILAFAIFVMFWVYTFYPPLINLFKDPVTNGYGI